MHFRLCFIGEIIMKSTNKHLNIKEYELDALNRLYEYLGFNEVTSFDDYIEFVFKCSTRDTCFEHTLNNMLRHIVTSFWNDNSEYKNSYIKTFWLNVCDVKLHTTVGSDIEYDPKGLVRYYVKNNFKKLCDTRREAMP